MGFLSDGSLVFTNQIGDAGCLRVIDRGRILSIYDLQVTPARIERGTTDIRL